MLKARDIMNTQPEHCQLNTPIADIIERFANENIDYILVLDEEQRLRGLITESDLIDQQASLHVPTVMMIFDMVLPLGVEKFEHEIARLQALTAEELMNRDIKTITLDADLDSIAATMSDGNAHHLPVIHDDSVEGIINSRDVIRALGKRHQ